MASQDIGQLGARDGEAVTVDCPISDSLAGAYLWIILVLLLLRKPNRTFGAWTVLFPLIIIHVILALAERNLNAYFVYTWHQQLCSTICDLLGVFALSVASYLAVCDLVRFRNRMLRFVSQYLVFLSVGGIAISHSAWPIGTPYSVGIVFGKLLVAFMVGHRVMTFVLRKTVRGTRSGWWHAALCVVFGLCPILILGILQRRWDVPGQSQDVLNTMRSWIILSAAFCLPYFVWFWFVILSLLVPFYAQRWDGVGSCAGPVS